MQYNPSVNDNRGNIIANSADNVARTTLAGYQSMADGISQAGRSVAGGIMGYGQERDRLEKESALIDGKTRAYAQMGVLSDADYAAMAKGNLAKKREILSQADAIYLDQVQRQNQGLQERKLNEDIRQFDVNHPAGWSPRAEKFNQDGTEVLVTQTSPFQGNVQVLKTPDTTAKPYFDPNTGQPVPGYGVLNGRLVNTNPNQMGGMMGALFGGGGAVPTAPGATAPAPTAKGKPTHGQVQYQGGHRYVYNANTGTWE
jgi:hypothetical protein